MENNKKIKISLELEINGNKKVFVAPTLKGRIYRDVFKMNRLLNEGVSESTVDTLVEFIAHDVFGDKFTANDYFDGITATKCMSEIMRVLSEIMTMIHEGLEQDTQE